MRIVAVLSVTAALFIGMLSGYSLHRMPHRYEVDTALGCVETIVTEAKDPTGQDMASGGYIFFKDDIAPGHGTENQHILGVYIPPGDYARVDAGDSIRACLLDIPSKDDRCDPDKDNRGREFLIYDRASGIASIDVNGEHGCGGA